MSTKPPPSGKPAAEAPADVKTASPSADPNLRGMGTVTNLANGQGTVQHEPKPEDYPPSARMTPPAVQVNTSAAQSVGEPDVVRQSGVSPTARAIEEGQALQTERIAEGHEKAERIADMRREIEEEMAA